MLLFWQSAIRVDLAEIRNRLILVWPMNSKLLYLFHGSPLVAAIIGLDGSAKVTVVREDSPREI
jgi:hypothetical protein